MSKILHCYNNYHNKVYHNKDWSFTTKILTTRQNMMVIYTTEKKKEIRLLHPPEMSAPSIF